MSFDNVFHGTPTVPVPSSAPALGVDIINNSLYIGSGSAWHAVGGSTGGVTAPVALTNGVFPKATGAATLANSALTEATTTLTSTKRLLLPNGTSNAPAIDFAGDPGTGIYDNPATITFVTSGAGVIAGMGNGSTASLTLPSNGSFGVSANANVNTIGDVAFSRASANIMQLGVTAGGTDTSGTMRLTTLAVGDGSASAPTVSFLNHAGYGIFFDPTMPTGDTGLAFTNNGTKRFTFGDSGTFRCHQIGGPANTDAAQIAGDLDIIGKLHSYNSQPVFGNGLAVESGVLDLIAQTDLIPATPIFTPTANSRCRVSVCEKITTPGTTSILGGAGGTVITYTDGIDSVAQSITMALKTTTGTIAINATGNTTTTSLSGDAYIYALAGVPIQIAVGYASTGTAMIYSIRATCELM